jgi:hypothetical protein
MRDGGSDQTGPVWPQSLPALDGEHLMKDMEFASRAMKNCNCT